MVAIGASLTDIECQIDFCVGKSRDRVHNWLDAEEDEEINFTRYKITLDLLRYCSPDWKSGSFVFDRPPAWT